MKGGSMKGDAVNRGSMKGEFCEGGCCIKGGFHEEGSSVKGML